MIKAGLPATALATIDNPDIVQLLLPPAELGQ